MRRCQGIVIHRGEIEVTNREYHVLIQRDGTRVRLCPDSDIAPHAKAFNRSTLGLCVFGDFASLEPGRNWTPTEAQYREIVNQCREWISQYGALWVKGHSELGEAGTSVTSKLQLGHTCPGERFDLERVRREVFQLIPPSPP